MAYRNTLIAISGIKCVHGGFPAFCVSSMISEASRSKRSLPDIPLRPVDSICENLSWSTFARPTTSGMTACGSYVRVKQSLRVLECEGPTLSWRPRSSFWSDGLSHLKMKFMRLDIGVESLVQMFKECLQDESLERREGTCRRHTLSEFGTQLRALYDIWSHVPYYGLVHQNSSTAIR